MLHFQSENQENTTHVVNVGINETQKNAIAFGESPMRSRSPLNRIDLNFTQKSNLLENPAKINTGPHLRESWKRYKDFFMFVNYKSCIF